MSSWQVELSNATQAEVGREIAPQGLKRVCENRKRNSRSLHYAPPDFLWNLVALANVMRLSLRKAAYVVVASAAR
jgi:hypothetical protein